jgi:uncharacterized protein involved in outer membrane biogenesis
MSIVRILKWVIISFTVAVVAAVLYLSFADLNWLKPRIEAAVADATGRQLTLGGDLDLDIVPSPAIVIEDVRLANSAWGSEPTMAQVGHFSARLDLWSLLSPPVRVKAFRLRDVDVLLETNGEDEANWVFGAGTEPEPAEQPESGEAAAARVPVIIEFAEIRNARLRYQAPQAEPVVASLATLDITTDDSGYTVLAGEGEVKELPLRLDGKLGPEQALVSGTDIGVDMSARLGNLSVGVDGTLGDIATPSGIDLTLLASSDDVRQTLEDFAVKLPLTGALQVDTRVTSVQTGTRFAIDAKVGEIAATATATHIGSAVDFEAAVPALDRVGEALEIQGLPAEELTVDGLVVVDPQAYQIQGVTIGLGEAEFKLDGALGQGTDAATELSLRADGPSLAALSAGLPEIAFKASLSASLTPEQLTFDAIEANFGESDLAGAIEVTMGEKTAIAGKLTSQRLDLTPFAGGGEDGEPEEKAESKQEEDAAESQYVFTEEPLPFEALQRSDVDFDVDIARLTINKLVLLDMTTAVDLKDGKLRLKNRFAGPQGGTSASDIALTSAGESADLAAKVNMRDLHLNLISGDIEDKSLVPPLGVTVDINSSGGSARALASSANGRVLVTKGQGQIENNLVGAVSGDIFAQLFQALNPLAKDEEFTTLDCLIFGLDITSGKADINGMYVQAEKIKIVGDGDIDLTSEALNIEFNTKPRKGVGVSADMFVTPFVKLTGTLASPSIGLDKKGALLAVGTGGLSVLAEAAADRAAGEKDSCAAVLAEVGDHPPITE